VSERPLLPQLVAMGLTYPQGEYRLRAEDAFREPFRDVLLKPRLHEAIRRINVTVRFIDFDTPDANDLLAINQLRVDPVGRTGFTIPDVVLFVNGIPRV